MIALDREGARLEADRSALRWREGAPLSALDGVPITVKDNLLVAGMKATWGSRIYADFVPEADEAPVARLRAAGAVIFGKTNVPEFTLQGYTTNLLFGTTRNPLAPDRTPGGSTGGGAAAVAAGIGPLAIGTDGGGSTRRPAAYCGLYGLKPSLGQIPRHGGFPQILSDFEVVGPDRPLRRRSRRRLRHLRGYDPRDPRTAAAAARLPPPGKRIGFMPRVGDAPVDPEIARAAQATARAFERLGFVVEEVAAPYTPTSSPRSGPSSPRPVSPGTSPRFPTGVTASAPMPSGWLMPAPAGRPRITLPRSTASPRCGCDPARSSRNGTSCSRRPPPPWPGRRTKPPADDRRQAGRPARPRRLQRLQQPDRRRRRQLPRRSTADAGGIGMQIAAPAGRDDDILAILKRWETEEGSPRAPAVVEGLILPACKRGRGPPKAVEGAATANVHSRVCTASGRSLHEPAWPEAVLAAAARSRPR